MEGRLRRGPGGILGILDELDHHGDAIEYDLLTIGLRLSDIGTGRCTWRDVLIVMKGAPRTSAYARAKLGVDAEWDRTNDLLAGLIDLLRRHRWLDTGKRGSNPQQIDRPSTRRAADTRVFGRGTSMTPAELDAWIAEQEARPAD